MPLVVISRHLSHACRVPAELFDILATHGGQLGKTVRDEQRESYTSPISPLYLPYISPIPPLHLPYISLARCATSSARASTCSGSARAPRVERRVGASQPQPQA